MKLCGLMTKCQRCGRDVEGLPYTCRYCGGTFCVDCHLPEEHNCPGLRRGPIGDKRLVPGYVDRDWELIEKLVASRVEDARVPVRVSRPAKVVSSRGSVIGKVIIAVTITALLAAVLGHFVVPRYTRPVDEKRAAQLIMEKINAYRVSNGLPPLQWSSYLESRCKKWADHLFGKILLEHSSPPSDGRAWGENLYMHVEYMGGLIIFPFIVIPYPPRVTTESLADEAFEGWRKSPGHNINMLYSAWRYGAVAVKCGYTSGYRCYVVAQFSDRP